MTSQADNVLVLRDSEGTYYALPRRTLMQFRVPDAWKAEFEAALDHDDVVGFAQPAFGSEAADRNGRPTSPAASAGGFQVQLRGLTSFEKLPDYDELAERTRGS